jgi:hypothetical protein
MSEAEQTPIQKEQATVQAPENTHTRGGYHTNAEVEAAIPYRQLSKTHETKDKQDLTEVRQQNADLLDQQPAGENRTSTPELFKKEQLRLLDLELAKSTPDEQEDILMMHNKDWRGWLGKHGTEAGQENFIAQMKARNENAENLTPSEDKKQYWEHVTSMLDMQPEDILTGIQIGSIKDKEALTVYAQRQLAQAEREMSFKIVGPDTTEQKEISALAVKKYKAVEQEVDVLLHGTPAEKAQYCEDKGKQWNKLGDQFKSETPADADHPEKTAEENKTQLTAEQQKTLEYMQTHPKLVDVLGALLTLDTESVQTMSDTLKQEQQRVTQQPNLGLIEALLTFVDAIKQEAKKTVETA